MDDSAQAAMFGLDLHDRDQRSTVERALESLPGTVAVRLVPGMDRPVDELHILVTLERGAKQVVRDVQSLLYTRFDLSIDHRVVSVVQLADDDPIATSPGREVPRIALSRTSVTQSAHDASVTVIVSDDDEIEHVGTADADVSVAGQREAAALATLRAVEALVADNATITLGGVEVVALGGAQIVLAAVELRTTRTRLLLTGSAVIRRGDVDATARAVLDAINRVLSQA